ncbi:unnamed protein product [Allacma fusca]|uniref:Uncharacterized protein n=1 Tax=Allacma fusca TaxID=39272 RepID=A0A8J2JVC6_9HEXA|nr:unnamed protein product [Allacma fusca]
MEIVILKAGDRRKEKKYAFVIRGKSKVHFWEGPIHTPVDTTTRKSSQTTKVAGGIKGGCLGAMRKRNGSGFPSPEKLTWGRQGKLIFELSGISKKEVTMLKSKFVKADYLPDFYHLGSQRFVNAELGTAKPANTPNPESSFPKEGGELLTQRG